MKPRSPTEARLCVAFGMLIILTTLGFHFWLDYARPRDSHDFVFLPLSVGAAFTWWGFFWMNPKRATEGGGSLVSFVERLRTVKLGRRESDAVAVIEPPAPPIIEDRHPVTPDTPVVVPQSVVHPPAEASD